MPGICGAARRVFAVAAACACVCSAGVAPLFAGEGAQGGAPYPPRGRISALMTALFHHDADRSLTGGKFGVDRDVTAFFSVSSLKQPVVLQ